MAVIIPAEVNPTVLVWARKWSYPSGIILANLLIAILEKRPTARDTTS